jgi:branched-chain amino acid aminotransferase
MQTTELIWQNGKLVPWADAKVHVLTHTLHYGGGAFEGIRCYDGVKGPAIFRLKEHVARLFYSAGALGMTVPYTQAEVVEAIVSLVRVNKMSEGYIRPLLFYGYGKMGVNPIGSPVEFMIACWPWGAYLEHESADIKVSRYIRIHPDSTIVDAKLCGHYVNGILASLELQGTHYDEALLLDANGYISEGVGENIFVVKEGVIYTPKLGTILAGITRETIFKLAASMSLKVVEADLKPEDAYNADEAFFTGTAAEVTPIRSIDDHVLNGGEIGPVSAKIKAAYHDVVRGKNSEFVDYLTYV